MISTISQRHLEAVQIMKNSYGIILEDFVGDSSSERVTSTNEDKNTVIIDGETDHVMKELDLLSNDLDNLLK